MKEDKVLNHLKEIVCAAGEMRSIDEEEYEEDPSELNMKMFEVSIRRYNKARHALEGYEAYLRYSGEYNKLELQCIEER
jgi:hypothetical protein